MRRHVAAPLAALLLWAAGPAVPARGADSPPKAQAEKPAPARDVVAVVDGVPLKVSDLGLVMLLGVPGKHGQPPARADLLDKLVEVELVVRYAERKGLPAPGKGRELLVLFHETTLGMEYAGEMRRNVRFDATEIRDRLPQKWRVASFEVVLYGTLDEAKADAASVTTVEQFDALKGKYPARAKAFDNVYPRSGFFNEFDDIAIFNRDSAGMYGAGETGIGPGIIRVREIREPAESEKEELLRTAARSMEEVQFSKEMGRVRQDTPRRIDKEALRRYVESVRSGDPLDIPVATVGSWTITSRQIRSFVANEPVNFMRSAKVEEIVAAYVETLERLADTLALAAEARRNGRSGIPPGQYKTSYENFRRKLLYEAGMEDGAGPVAVSDAEVREYYEANRKTKFTLSERVEAAHILAKDKRKADKALRRIQGGESFEEVAKELSEDSQSAPRGGKIGWILKDGKVLPEIEKNAFRLKEKPGSVSPVFRTGNGYHILKVYAWRPEEEVPFGKAEGVARRDLEDARYEAGKKAFLEGLRKNATVTTYPENVPDVPAKGSHR